MYYSGPVMQIYQAGKHFEDSLFSTIKMMKIAKQNKYLVNAMNVTEDDVCWDCCNDKRLDVKKTKKNLTNTALMLYIKDNPTGMLWYLGYTVAEFIFWILVVALSAKIGGIYGIGLLVWNMIASQITGWLYSHDVLNKHWRLFSIIDTIISIGIYFAIGYFAFFLASS
jgi:hypothetical protein